MVRRRRQGSGITIADVAQKAGVSRTAVSFAFNDPSQLSGGTLRRILEVANDLGYYPNPAARTLTTKRIGAIGLLIPQHSHLMLANPFFTEFLQGVASVCDEYDFSLLLVPPQGGSVLRALNAAAVDGFLAIGLDRAHDESRLLARRQTPFVMVDADPLPDVSSVNVDDAAGAAQAAQLLLDAGHQRVLILAISPPDQPFGVSGDTDEPAQEGFNGVVQRRLAGYRSAFEASGVEWRADWIVECASTREGGRAAFDAVWAAGLRPTAVLAMSDIVALGVLEAARAVGISAPHDFELIGFDDIALSQWITPALSTVRQPSAEKGARATRMLLSRMAVQLPSSVGGQLPADHVVLATTLVLRQTTQPRKGVISPEPLAPVRMRTPSVR